MLFKVIYHVKDTDERYHKGVVAIYKCFCGKEFKSPKAKMNSGYVSSCGCITKCSYEINKVQVDTKKLVIYKLNRLKKRAAEKKIEISLSPNQVEELILSPCHYCCELAFPCNGVDRLDNNKGYTPDNCVSCCSSCNYFKGGMSYDKFIEKISKIFNNLNS